MLNNEALCQQPCLKLECIGSFDSSNIKANETGDEVLQNELDYAKTILIISDHVEHVDIKSKADNFDCSITQL